jgi:hypothetical protein
VFKRRLEAKIGRKRTLKRREEASSPFHKRYSRAKFAVSRYANLIGLLSGCLLPSVVKDRRSAQQFPIGTSPLPAERGIGLEPKPRKNLNKIKNPATSAGRIRPSLWALFPRALGRMCSQLVFFLPGVRNQPHLWMSRQARSVSRLPRESGLHQHHESISKSKVPSSCIQDFFTSAS